MSFTPDPPSHLSTLKIWSGTTGLGLVGISGKFRLRNIATLAAGLTFVALACRRLDYRTTTEVLKRMSLPLLALSAAALFTFYFLRAVRWAIILRGKVGISALFMYSSIGYLVSSVAPAQAGELVKPALVRARHGLPYFATAASVVVERLLDVTTLLLLGTVAFFTLPTHTLGPVWVAASLKTGCLLCAIGFLILILGNLWADEISHIVSNLLSLLGLSTHLAAWIREALRSLLHGANGVLSPIYLCYALLCSLALWICNAGSVAIIFLAVHGHALSIPTFLLGFSVLSLGLAIPLTPGYIGQYEGLWLVVFVGLHIVREEDALTVCLICHGLILLTIALFGLLGLGYLWLSSRLDGSFSKNPVPSP